MQILEFRAFTIDGDATSGNPAGVVLDATDLTPDDMVAIAARLGHSETAFVLGIDGDDVRVRYFTPRAEIAFCGHATVATGVEVYPSFSTPTVAYALSASANSAGVVRSSCFIAPPQ